MERRSAYLAFGIAALALALVGAGITMGIMFTQSSMDDSGDGSQKTLKSTEGDVIQGNESGNGSQDTGPGSEADTQNFDGHDPLKTGDQPLSSDDNGGRDGDAPWFIYAAAVSALIAALLFVAISGRAYAESSRHESVVRNDLVDLISFNPGINLSSIRNELQLSQGAVSYHLRRLEKGGVIYSYKGMKERRFYPASMGYNQVENRSAADEVRSIIANPTGARIVDILGRGDATQSQIVKEVGVSPSTVHWHMDRMEKVGIIRKKREGRAVIYGLSKALKDT
jgi:predicted transcriptional regulator